MKTKNSKSSGSVVPIWIIVAAIITTLITIFSALFFSISSRSSGPQKPIVNESTSKVAEDETSTWKTYTNSSENFSFKYPPDWNIANESSITNGVPPQLSKTIIEGDKAALLSVLKFKTSEFSSESLQNFTPFGYKQFEKNGNTYVLITYTNQIGANSTKETEQTALDVLSRIASTFKFIK